MPFGIIYINPRAMDVIYSTEAKRSRENMLITLSHTMLADILEGHVDEIFRAPSITRETPSLQGPRTTPAASGSANGTAAF